ncbi:MAG: putative PIG3 family NAD(P)H quinone oxidoreductase [Actinomycetes bacterium]|jgi:putative PIG3 family NAD(P)H quinone oxidoreductase
MFAVTVTEPGGSEQLAWTQVPEPELTDDGVLIDVAATAVNRADVMQRMGLYPPPPGVSDVIGLECSGTIAMIGADVTGWKVGDQVCALLAGGGYAEQVAVPAGQVMALPPGIDVVTAAGLVEVACTVWSNLINVARLQPGELVLIHGGSGGIGTHAIQLCKALGATVAITAGSDAKVARCLKLGADIGINYRNQDFVEVIQSESRGADVILDNMGAKYLQRNVAALAPDGRLVIIGLQGGIKAELNIGSLLGKRATVCATSLRSRPADQKAAICREVAQNVWPLFADGSITPVVEDVLPITQAAAAHDRMEASTHTGKLILTI